MAEGDGYHLHWKDAGSNFAKGLSEMRQDEELQDVTLICSDGQTKAHKVVLASGSKFFKEIFYSNPHQHPMLYLFGVTFEDLNKILDFLYLGEVKIKHEKLDKFVEVASNLRIKGLCDVSDEEAREMGLPGNSVIKEHCNDTRKRKEGSELFHKQAKKKKLHKDGNKFRTTVVFDSETTTFDIDSDGSETYLVEPNQRAVKSEAGQGYVIEEGSDNPEATEIYTRLVNEISDNYRQTDRTDYGKFQCILCSFMTGHRYHMIEHQESNHIANLQYLCGDCGSSFKARHLLRRHKSKTKSCIEIRQRTDVVFADDMPSGNQ